MRGTKKTRFAFTRYGNVVGTNGSVVPFYRSLAKTQPTPVTHPDSTRYWITLPDANKFVLDSLVAMEGGETFIPKMKSVRIMTLATTMRAEESISIIGLRPGDKIHEKIDFEHHSGDNDMLTPEEIRRDIAALT